MNKRLKGFIFIGVISLSAFIAMDSKDSTYNSGSKWQLIWSDEFDQEQLDDSKWNRQVEKAGRFNEEWQRYTANEKNAFIEDGRLVIKAIHESDVHGLDQYSSARLNTANKFSFKYGKVAARIKLPYSMGIWPAFWMLGANIDENGGDTPWPQSGEIDILELYGFRNDAVIEANIHYANKDDDHEMMGPVEYHLKEGIFADDFHIFELEWNKDQISWSVDGDEFFSTPINTSERSEFHEEFFLLLNIAVGGTFSGRPDKASIFPQTMEVDWIRVYQK